MANLPIPDEDTFIAYDVTTSDDGPFSFTFSIFEKANLRVKAGDTELTQSEFTFSGTLIDTGYDGGSITLSTPVANTTVTIWREVAPVRATDFAPSSSVSVVAIDSALDRLTAQAQDARRDIDRAVIAPIGEAGHELPARDNLKGKLLYGNILTGTLEALTTAAAGEAFKGDPGGNIMSIGLFTAIATMTAPDDTDVIRTAGYTTLGKGGGFYMKVASEPTSLPSSAYSVDYEGNWWALIEQAANPYHFGAVGDGSTSDATAINHGMLWAADTTYGNGVLYVPKGEFAVGAQLLHPSHVCLYGWPGGKILRTWHSTNGNKSTSATIRATDGIAYGDYRPVDGGGAAVSPYYLEVADGDYADGCRLGGSLYIGMTTAARAAVTADTSSRMPCAYYNGCDRLVVEDGVTLEHGGRDWCLTLHGNDITIGAVNIIGGTNVYEDGIHIMGGHNGTITGAHVQAGDDALAFGSNYNQPISGWVVTGCKLNSNAAHCIRFVQNREGTTASDPAATQRIEKITIAHCTGQGGVISNGVIRVDDPEMLVFASILNIDFTHSTVAAHTGLNRDAIYLAGGTVTITGVIRSPVRRTVYAFDGAAGMIDLISEDAGQVSAFPAVYLFGAGDLEVNGRYRAYDRSAVQITDCATVIRSKRLETYDIQNTRSGVELTGTSVGFRAEHLTVTAASGATTAVGVTGVSGADIRIDSFCPRGVRPIGNPSTPASLQTRHDPGEGRTLQIVSGAVTTYFDKEVALTSEVSGSPDILSTMGGGRKGQKCVLRNGATDPATETITIGTTSAATSGAFLLGPNRVLATADDRIEVEHDGIYWVERGRRAGVATYNPPSLTAGSADTAIAVVVQGAAVGDVVLGASFSVAGLSFRSAYVSAADTVTLTPLNATAGTLDMASGTVTVIVAK